MPTQRVPNKGTPDFPFQTVVDDTIVIETSSRYQQNYAPIEPGTPFNPLNHSIADVAEFTGTLLVGQNATQGSPEMQDRVWASPPTLQDLYNYEIDFSAEEAGYPIFKRSYLILRDGYRPLGTGTLFSGLYAVNVTAAGSGYPQYGAVTFTGGGGTGATGIVIVDNTGAIVKITLKSEGSGYTSAPTAVLPSGGSGGAAVGVLQATNCLLVSEKVTRTPDKYRDSIYFVAQRTYETLPGPWIYDTSLAEDSEVVVTKRRHNISVNITPGESNSGGTLTKTTSKGITNYLAWEIVETRPLPGLVLTDYDQEPETQALITTTFQIVANPVSAPTPTPGVLVKVKHIDDYNSWLITETRSTPSGWTYQENAAFHFPSLFDYTQYSWTDSCGAFSTERAGFSCNVQMLIEVSFSNTVDEFTGLQLIPNTIELGKGINVSGVLVDAGSLVYSGTCTGTITFPASSPSYSGYLALIGTSQLVGGSSKKTKYGDFRTEQLFVTML